MSILNQYLLQKSIKTCITKKNDLLRKTAEKGMKVKLDKFYIKLNIIHYLTMCTVLIYTHTSYSPADRQLYK